MDSVPREKKILSKYEIILEQCAEYTDRYVKSGFSRWADAKTCQTDERAAGLLANTPERYIKLHAATLAGKTISEIMQLDSECNNIYKCYEMARRIKDM